MILDGQLQTSITRAAQLLQRGELLGLPTETVYGLAADAGQDDAVRKIFAIKGRPSEHPLIVHVADASGVARFASNVPAFAAHLMAAFWPGPLTLILLRREGVAAVAAGGQNSVGLRCPSHPLAHAVLVQAQMLGVWGVAAPSANLFGRVSPTTAAHVQSEFGDTLCVLDGGACEVGIESTIVDCTREHPVLLRPGVLTLQQLSEACGEEVVLSPALQGRLDENAPRASGTLASHYAPRAKVRLMSIQEIEQSVKALPVQGGESIALWLRSEVNQLLPAGVQRFEMPHDAAACAHDLFAQLRYFDDLGMKQIWIEMPPVQASWDGVKDRLLRAAASVD